MFGSIETALIIIAPSLSFGVIGWFYISTKKTFDTFNSLDISIQNKLRCIEHYMFFVRNCTPDELTRISLLPEDILAGLNAIPDAADRIQTAREKIEAAQRV